MPTVTLNRKVVDKLIGKKLSDDKLKERISFLGTDLENLDAKEIHVEIFPNRPDMLSEQGFSRALSSFIGTKPGLKKYSVKKSNHKVIVEESVKEVRPYTACAIVKNLKFDHEKIKEIIQIQEKLHITYGRNRKKCAIGVYPFEKIKTPIRFIAKKPQEIKFQPLESKKELTGLQILSQHPTGRDYGHLLEGKDKFPIFVDANDNVLSMPPIINLTAHVC
jgi:phenylalanyl-tRNA synthetase beta chain